jgi:hypothetical protein
MGRYHLTETGYFVTVNDKETYLYYYDTIIYCLHRMLRKHKSAMANSLLAMAQVEVFALNPTGLVLLHFTKEDIPDGFATCLCVGGDKTFVEVVHLWLESGKGRKLMEEGFAFIEKYSWETWKAERFVVSVTRSPKLLYEKFYSKLNFKPVGLILERDIQK